MFSRRRPAVTARARTVGIDTPAAAVVLVLPVVPAAVVVVVVVAVCVVVVPLGDPLETFRTTVEPLSTCPPAGGFCETTWPAG